MRLRGFKHHSPLEKPFKKSHRLESKLTWPLDYIDLPHEQYSLLASKYKDKPFGRIPLPQNISQLWSYHKYSVMARDPLLYSDIGPKVAKAQITFKDLSRLMVEILRSQPLKGRLINALEHMWGYVSHSSPFQRKTLNPQTLLKEIQNQAKSCDIQYLMHSTALGELGVWISVSLL
jgi:hypothetical protein